MSIRILISPAIAVVLAAASFVFLPRLDAASWQKPYSPQLLEPTGSQPVGVRRFQVDTGADDPWNPGHARVVMVDIHYPAADGEHPLRHYAKAQYLSELAMLAWSPDHEERLGLRDGEVHWLFRTHSHEWTPPQPGGYPVVVISAPRGVLRTSFTTLAEDLASHGHVVMTIDHPYDAPAVELWPTRKVIEPDDAVRQPTPAEVDAALTADVTAVADQVHRIDDEIGEVLSLGCVLVVTGRLQRALTGLTDEPMLAAQFAARIPRIKDPLDSDRTTRQAERDFRARSAQLRTSLKTQMEDESGCPGPR